MKNLFEKMADLNNQLLKVMSRHEFSLTIKVQSSDFYEGSKIAFVYEQGAETISSPTFDWLYEELMRTKLNK